MSSRWKRFFNIFYNAPSLLRVFFCFSCIFLTVNTLAAENTFTIAVKPQHVPVPQGSVTQTNVEIVDLGKYTNRVYLEIHSERGKTLDGFDFEFSGVNSGYKAAANRSDLFVGSQHWITVPDRNNKSVSQLTIVTYPDTVPGEYTFIVHGQRDAKKTVDRYVGRGLDTVPTEIDDISKASTKLKVTVTADPLFIELIEPVEFEVYPEQPTIIAPPSAQAYFDQIHVSATRSLETIKLKVALNPKAIGISVALDHKRVKPQRWTNNLLVAVTEEAKPGTYIATITATSRGANNKTLTKTTQVKIIVPEKVVQEEPKTSIGNNLNPIKINCVGSGCPSEPIIGTCLGNACSESFTLNCESNTCPKELKLDCFSSTCPSQAEYNCDDKGCGVFADGFDTGDTFVWPTVNRTLPTPKIKTCQACQSIADQIYALDERLVELESFDSEDEEEVEKHITEQKNNVAEQARLRTQLADCEKQCPSTTPSFFSSHTTPINVNCVGTGCTEGISATCYGSSCGESFDLNCPGTDCPDNLKITCLWAHDYGGASAGEKCNSFTYICDKDQTIICQQPFDVICGDGPCSQQTPSSTLSTMQNLQQALTKAEQDAIAANNYANTVANSFTQNASLSTITSDSLGAAIWAAGVQKFLIDFASALADLASVSDFFEGLAKGDMKDNTLLQNLDSIYEMAKDGESAVNNLSGNMATGLDMPGDAPSSPVVNDVFGTMGTADQYWGTDGLTNINSLKSDFSDIANIIDDYRGGKPLNKRTLGQLVIRIGKGIAENDLKEREAHIKQLEGDLVAEQVATSGLAAQLVVANDAKWQAMDALKALRAAIAVLTESNPESLAGSGNTSAVVAITAKCPECQGTADKLNQNRRAAKVIQDKIAAIERKQEALKNKKAKLKHLRDALAGFDRVTAGARQGLDNTDVPVLGPSQEIQNDINLRAMDRLKAVNEIGRLEREIEIEEGEDPAAELARLREADSKLRRERRELRGQLDACDQEPCKTNIVSEDNPFAAVAGLPITPEFDTGGAPGRTDIHKGKIGTNCIPCKAVAERLNAKLTELTEAKERADKRRAEILRRVEQIRNGAPYTEQERSNINQYSNAQNTETADDDFGAAAGVMVGDAHNDPVLFSYWVALSGNNDRVKDLEEDVNNLLRELLVCEKQCAIVELIDVISITGNAPFDRRDPISESSDSNTSTSSGTVSVIFCATCGGGVNIKVTQARIKIAGPDACPSNHYHQSGALPAIACDGNTYADPIPGACGYGEVPNTTTVSATSCPTP